MDQLIDDWLMVGLTKELTERGMHWLMNKLMNGKTDEPIYEILNELIDWFMDRPMVKLNDTLMSEPWIDNKLNGGLIRK